MGWRFSTRKPVQRVFTLVFIGLYVCIPLTSQAQPPMLLRDIWHVAPHDQAVTHVLFERGHKAQAFDVPLFQQRLTDVTFTVHVKDLPSFSPAMFSLYQRCEYNHVNNWVVCELTNSKHVAIGMSHLTNSAFQLLSHPRPGNVMTFRWSPTQQWLAYTDALSGTRYQPTLTIYDAVQGQSISTFGPFAVRILVGWRDATTVLAIVRAVDEDIFHLMAFDMRDHTSLRLTSLDAESLLFLQSFIVSPNSQFAVTLIQETALQTRRCLYHFSTNHCTPFVQPPNTELIWSPDTMGLLAMGYNESDPSYYIALHDLAHPIPLTLPVKPWGNQRDRPHQLITIAPDKRYILFAEPRQMVMYDVLANRWVALHAGRSHIVGWRLNPEDAVGGYKVFFPVLFP
jgi:hypothetical protein